MSDHFVSEAIYLTDPDGHGIEIYHDRPREVWERQGGQPDDDRSSRRRLPPGELDDPASEPFAGSAAGTDMGHVHLQVADIEDAVGFYRDVLGFELMAELFGSAAFLGGGRLPPSRRGEHLAQPRRRAGARRGQRRSATRRSCSRAREERDGVISRVADAGRDRRLAPTACSSGILPGSGSC